MNESETKLNISTLWRTICQTIAPIVTRPRVRLALWISFSLLFITTGLVVTGRWLVTLSWRHWPQEVRAQYARHMESKPQKKVPPPKKGPNKALFLVIDTAQNKIYLRQGEQVVHEATVSVGSGNILEDPKGKRRWVFDTPRGEFDVKYKLRDPIWIKPDWAFIEEGKEIPLSQQERLEAGVLGDYALGFGDGFFIHGTLYTRLLGRSVTHGCVRVGDKDLAELYKKVPIGTKIYIF